MNIMKNKVKNLFGTPKKAVVSVICTAAVLAVLAEGTACAAASRYSVIGEDAAKSYAFADAGVSAEDVQLISIDVDYERGQHVYEIDFISGGIEYEYDIRTSDGKVVKKSTEVVNPTAGNTAGAGTSESGTVSGSTQAAGTVTLEEAKETALADAALTADGVTFTKTAQDYDDGITVYDIEFYTADAKYEYEITTDTGVIYSKSVNAFITAASGMTANITIDEAKTIAVSDAGAALSEATFTSAKQDREDGSLVYDLEFYVTGCKYEYEISAYDGAIREKSVKVKNNTVTSDNSSASQKTDKPSGGNTSGSSSGSTGSYITTDEAKEIAVNTAGLSLSDVTFKKTKLEKDDGIMVYEIEFYYGRLEYEITINASNGTVLEYDIDN